MSIARRTTVLVMTVVAGLVAPAGVDAAESPPGPGSDRPPRISATEVVGPNGEPLVAGYLNDRGQVVAEVHEWNGTPDPQGTVVFWERGRATFVEPEGVEEIYTFDLSDRGQVVGQADGHAYSWRDGRWRLLSAGDTSGIAYATNDRGQVAGVRNPNTESHEVVVWQDGGATPAPASLTSRFPIPLHMNDRGQVTVSEVTEPEPGSFRTACLLWQVGGGLTDLGGVGGGYTACRDINDRGQVVGESATADGEVHAFLWDDGEMTDLGTLGGVAARSEAVDVNEHGDAVGWSSFYGPEGREVHAVLWRDGEIVDLGSLGGAVSQAHAINDRGQVVGSSTIGFQDRPFLWEHGRMTDLTTFVDPELGATGGGAFRINDRGQVLGMVSTPSGSETPLSRTILWTTRGS